VVSFGILDMGDARDPGADQAPSNLRKLNEFALAMLEQHTLEDLLWNMADKIGVLLGFDDCVIYLCEGNALVQAAAFGIKSPREHEISERIVIPRGEGIVGTVADTGVAEFVRDTREDPRYIADQFAGTSEMTVPLIFEGETLGVLDSEGSTVDAFSDQDFVMFQSVANIAAGRIAWLRSEQSRQRAETLFQSERMESLGMLAGGIAHDFNNLLAVMSMNLELSRMVTDPAEAAAALETMEKALDRARGLTKQLMTFGTGGAPLRELVEVPALLRETVRFIESYPAVECELAIEGSLPVIQADLTQLSQVLHNLLLNAVQAMGEKGRILVSARRTDDNEGPTLEIRVRDEGPGMATSVASRVFDPYYTTKRDGSGLGLAMSYWIVMRHGGDLTMDTAPGKGCEFRITLRGVEGRIARPNPPDSKTPTPLRVLVLDDDDEVRDGVCALLQLGGHDAVAVADGREVTPAWERARDEGRPFDLALLDLANPGGMDGVSAMKHLIEFDPDARAAVMSGYSEGRIMEDYAAHGFVARIEKPFRRSELEAMLARVTGEAET
jgi:signal transduction histidine kinase